MTRLQLSDSYDFYLHYIKRLAADEADKLRQKENQNVS